MALVPNSIYGYTNLNDVQVFIKTDDLTDRGDWNSTIPYVLNDAAFYLGAYYICLTANTGTPPNGNISDEWSTLALIRSEQAPNDYILNGTRVIHDYHIAWGTNANNSEVSASDMPYQGGYPTVQTAIDALFSMTGTTGVATIAQQGSAYSYNLYVAGTNYTNSAVQTVSQGSMIGQAGSNYAFGLFVQGTNYTNSRDLLVAQYGSQFAYDLYIAGTNYANSLSQGGAVSVVAQQGSQLAFIVRDQGTNYTDNRFSVAAQIGSQYSTILRDQGTNYTNAQVAVEAVARANGDAVVGQQGSNYTFGLYVAGTNYAASLSQGGAGTLIAQNGSQFSVILRDQGTNYTNAQVNIEAAARIAGDLLVAQRGSEHAYDLYIAGTNYAASLAGGGSNVVISIVLDQTAQTEIPTFADSSGKVLKGSGVMAEDGEIVAGAISVSGDVLIGDTLEVGGQFSLAGVPIQDFFNEISSNGSGFSTSLRDQGTNYTNSQVTIVAVNGSNYVNSQMTAERNARVFGNGTTAQQGSNYSFGLYVAGTNYAASLAGGATTGTAFSNVGGLQWSFTGSSSGPKDAGIYHGSNAGQLVVTDGGSAVGTYGGTNLATLRVKNIELQGTTSVMGQNGTVSIDFAGYAAQTVIMTGTVVLNSMNRQPDRSALLRLIASGTNRLITWPSAWVWLGSASGPVTVLQDKTMIISCQCWGISESDVTACFTSQY